MSILYVTVGGGHPVEMHSINLKMISEQILCLAKMILKQNLLFSI